MKQNEEWRNHLKRYYETHNVSLKEAMIEAKKTYTKKNGKGVYQDVVNVINKVAGSNARPLKDGEYHLPLSNYTGPGTNLDYNLKHHIEPANKTDSCSMKHDIQYNEIMNTYKDNPKERSKQIRFADEAVKDCYKKVDDEPILSNLAYAGIQLKNTFEDIMPSFVAKKVQGNYYGSKKGSNIRAIGDAKKIMFNSIK